MKNIPIIILLAFMCIPFYMSSQSIVTTKHNLSASGTGTVKATIESEVCVFCHTPHGSTPRAPLWNRDDSGNTYTLYNSSTLEAVPGQPDGSSILCLSCHDGTVALGKISNRSTEISMSGSMSSKGNLTTDLSDDHPISFTYNSSLVSADGELKPLPLSTAELDINSKVQCSSCHEPHNEIYPKFLRASNEFSAICFLCHDKTYWTQSSHNTSTNNWNGSGTNPWTHLEPAYPTVAQNGCANCHDTHNASGKIRLLKSAIEENNCLDCHNGNVASKNIQAELVKTYTHDVYQYSGIHDPSEQNAIINKHVECQDCHNPHASNNDSANAPLVSGFGQGVDGINQDGNPVSPVTNAYEICYKCHAGNAWAPSPALPRIINQNNVRLEFATSNPSFHPIVGARNRTDIDGLIAPNASNTVLYCASCHASDNPNGPAGPHGSIYPQILKLQYETADYTNESAQAYALCYSCHNRNNFVFGQPWWRTFREHRTHVVWEDTPCSVCHDPHGISSSQGNSTNNSNLINFRTDVVTPSSSGRLEFIDTGDKRGRCYLTCHGEDHDPLSY